MINRMQDIVLGATLVALAIIWTWLVIDTIPPGFGDGEIGARAFPLAFGVILFLLSALLLVRIALTSKAEPPTAHLADELNEPDKIRWVAALMLLAEIGLYGFLLEKIGFVMATPIIVILVMLVNLRVQSISKILGMSLGLTVGCWLIFEKVLGIYLANGTWANVG